ncbi:MAG: class I SAM-dependent methyltransferase [Oscillospiraceae bacterium]|nr:class I SAM-dependent methyltransferase [Oscillospiraceae bacterium]
MFWDRVAGVYDIFVNIINTKTHQALKKTVSHCISSGEEALECACGTGLLTSVIAEKCAHLTATGSSSPMPDTQTSQSKWQTGVYRAP